MTPPGPATTRMPRVPLIAALILSASLAAGSPGPSILLYGAGLDQTREFAIESALARGWRLIWVAPEGVAFEQTLEEADEAEGSGPSRVIRVFASFSAEGGGVRVQLRAEEFESPGGPEERSADVTDRYGLNLANALSSLRARWDTRPASGGHASEPSPGVGERAPRRPEGTAPLGPVGTWAYYAEDYAQSRGCALTDSGARLDSAGADWERHRVPCQDGRVLRVYCYLGDCTAAPP
ncbi:MAG: hypothetical protein ACM3ST_13445 [Bdellovibrio bacteriovorus]